MMAYFYKYGAIRLVPFLTMLCYVSVWASAVPPPFEFDPFSNREFAAATNLSTGEVLVHLVNNVVVRFRKEEIDCDSDCDDDVQSMTALHGYLVSGTFSDFAYGRGGNAVEAHSRLHAILDDRIAAINLLCNLTKMQLQKLKLAGCGDIKWFFDDMHTAESRFATYREINDEQAMNMWLNDLKSMHHSSTIRNGDFTTAFGDGSLFARTVQHMLTAEQKSRVPGLRPTQTAGTNQPLRNSR